MPVFRPLSQERVSELTRRSATGAVDLTDQKLWISRALAEADGWGGITIDPGDSTRAIKRRTTIAGKEMGKTVKWHRRSTDQELIFRVISIEAEIPKRRRARKAKPVLEEEGADPGESAAAE